MTTTEGGTFSTTRQRGLAMLLIGLAVVALGCTSKEETSPNPASESSVVQTSDPGSGEGMTAVDALDLSLRLPPSFEVASDPELALLARSLSPRAILSISPESSSISDHQAEPGETVERVTIAGRDAVVVSNANVDGLPTTIVANEILVSNGENSFSLILSSDAASLSAMWQPTIESIRFSS